MVRKGGQSGWCRTLRRGFGWNFVSFGAGTVLLALAASALLARIFFFTPRQCIQCNSFQEALNFVFWRLIIVFLRAGWLNLLIL